MKKYLLICISFALATLSTALGQSHAYLWDPTTGIRDLGTLGGDSQAYGVNDSGTVVGWYIPTDGRIYFHGTPDELRYSTDQLIQDFLLGRSEGTGD